MIQNKTKTNGFMVYSLTIKKMSVLKFEYKKSYGLQLYVVRETEYLHAEPRPLNATINQLDPAHFLNVFFLSLN